MAKIAQGADKGDHFRTTEIKHGYEGRGWAQRAALLSKPKLLGIKVKLEKILVRTSNTKIIGNNLLTAF